MTATRSDATPTVWVALDISKYRHDALVELPTGIRKKFKVANSLADFEQFAAFLRSVAAPCRSAFEATGDYHRPIANFLLRQGFHLSLVSSIAVARTRDARYNSWDRNDPKDAQVILHLLKTGTTQIFSDPLESGYNDLQELANTYQQVSLRKVRLHHSIMTHFLPLYFPEAERYGNTSRAEWFTELLAFAPCPSAVLAYSKAEFVKRASKIGGQKHDKARWLANFYETARSSVGIPVAADSEAVRMFRVMLEEYRLLCRRRRELEEAAVTRLSSHDDFRRLQTIPGVGSVLALIILAESGDLRRFSHYRKYLKYCGLDLCTEQSGQFRGKTKLSKRGNARLRYAYWMAGAVAVRLRENSFRRKFDDYIRLDPTDADLKRKARTAVAAMLARAACAMITTGTDYRRFPEAAVPCGRIPSLGAVEATVTS